MRVSATVVMFCVLVLLHGLFGDRAQAQWLSMHEDATLTTYTERSELIQMDRFVNVAEMLDYKRKMRNEEGHIFQSVVIKAQYNCPDNRVRIYTIELFDERMARGDVVNTQKIYGPWKAINPRSVEQELKNFSCTGQK
jgi:hypothetical protein